MMTAKRKKEKPADNVIRCNMTPFPRSYGDPSGIPCDLSQQMLRTRKLLQQHIEKYAKNWVPQRRPHLKFCVFCVCVVFYSPLHFSVQNHFIFNHHVLATSMCRLLTRCILFYCSQDRWSCCVSQQGAYVSLRFSHSTSEVQRLSTKHI